MMNPLRTLPGVVFFVFLVSLLVSGYLLIRWWQSGGGRTPRLLEYLRNPSAYPDWVIRAQSRCPGAPFAFPTEGYIGYLWGDSFRPLTRHTGIDVFGGKPAGQTPIFSASDGFLTRLPEWKSAVIVRVPDDPLQPGRGIWLYYAHMADAQGNSFIDAAFPPGTYDKPVATGTPLGFQGDYSGDPSHPTGVHLHLSIVLGDGSGGFRNETDIRNTLDPSPYFGMALNADAAGDEAPHCLPPHVDIPKPE
jgi:hypothetical protein